MTKARYITTTLPYVNDDPHLGHALEFVQADALARYRRLLGDTVFFTTGVDEHGQKILEKATAAGQGTQEYVDHFAARFQKLKETFNLSYDNFIRTTDPAHIAAAQEIWKRCEAAGDIYKKKYSGLYCVGCEKFIKEDDLVDGLCPDHKKAPVEVEEENYFFRLSKYQGRLADYLVSGPVIIPEHRRKEALAFVEAGLEDFSISREKERMSWGIPVPGDARQVMYVWFDALTNYISTLGWPDDADGNFEKFWVNGETLQLAGKDQVRFQSIMWQAMLMSADIKGTDQVFYHGFITSGGQKMSKSIGNVISPFDMSERYGTEAMRYILLRHVHPTQDSDITRERMDEWYTANLVNGLGNVTARVMKLAETHLENPITDPGVVAFPKEYIDTLEAYDFMAAMDFVWSRIQMLDEKITDEEPFKVVKDDVVRGRAIIYECVEELLFIAVLLAPFLPQVSETIKTAVFANKKPENLFPRIEV